MTDFKRTIRCSKCNVETPFSVSSDFEINEMSLMLKCKCGNSIQINYIILEKETEKEIQKSTNLDFNAFSLDESLLPPEIPSDTLRDLIEG